jgi:hypothetical protein
MRWEPLAGCSRNPPRFGEVNSPTRLDAPPPGTHPSGSPDIPTNLRRFDPTTPQALRASELPSAPLTRPRPTPTHPGSLRCLTNPRRLDPPIARRVGGRREAGCSADARSRGGLGGGCEMRWEPLAGCSRTPPRSGEVNSPPRLVAPPPGTHPSSSSASLPTSGRECPAGPRGSGRPTHPPSQLPPPRANPLDPEALPHEFL